MHIPKCAGTSFMEMAMSVLPHHQVVQTTSLIRNRDEGRPQFLEISKLENLRLIWGHAVHEEMLYVTNQPFLFTGLREPSERLASHAKFDIYLAKSQGRETIEMSEWLRLQSDPICKFIVERFPRLSGDPSRTLFERARDALEAFDFCYFTETFEESSKAILAAMGYSAELKNENVATVDIPVEIDPALIQNDIELYSWARDHFANRSIDPERPKSERLRSFLSSRPCPNTLDDFMFHQQAYEFDFWNVIDLVVKEKSVRAERLLKEINYYLQYKRIY